MLNLVNPDVDDELRARAERLAPKGLEDWLDAMYRLRSNETEMRNLVREGKILLVRDGRKKRVLRGSVDEYILGAIDTDPFGAVD